MSLPKDSPIYGPTELRIARKKTREALSGVDLFSSAYHLLSEQLELIPRKIDFRMNKFIHKMPVVKLIHAELSEDPLALARFQFESGGKEYTLFFYEGINSPVETYSFDEASIVQLCKVHDDKVSLNGSLTHSPIQVFATMSKVLCLTRGIQNSEQMILTRIQFEHYDPKPGSLSCEVRFRFENMVEFNVSEILLQDQTRGTLYWKWEGAS